MPAVQPPTQLLVMNVLTDAITLAITESVSHSSHIPVLWSPNCTCSTVHFFTHVHGTATVHSHIQHYYNSHLLHKQMNYPTAHSIVTTAHIDKAADQSTSLKELLDSTSVSITGPGARRHYWKLLSLTCMQYHASQHTARGCRRGGNSLLMCVSQVMHPKASLANTCNGNVFLFHTTQL
jgi:hypothetical protein